MTDHFSLMTMPTPSIYTRALTVIEEIYLESQYGSNDLYRIQDLIHSLDIKQWESKRWLVREMKTIFDRWDIGGPIYIAGGWYGLLAALLQEEFPRPHNYIMSADVDPLAEIYGHKLWPGRDFGFITEDSLEELDPNLAAWVSTSTEHFDPYALDFLLRSKSEHTWAVLQNNNYFGHQSHINCYVSVDQFIDSLPLKKISYRGELDLGDFKRFMVIGR